MALARFKELLIIGLLIFPHSMAVDCLEWKITDPHGNVSYRLTSGDIVKINPDVHGTWVVETDVCYDHEDEDGNRYCAHAVREIFVDGSLFSDGFESGGTGKWKEVYNE